MGNFYCGRLVFPHSTAPCPIIIMPSARLGSDRFLSHWFKPVRLESHDSIYKNCRRTLNSFSHHIISDSNQQQNTSFPFLPTTSPPCCWCAIHSLSTCYSSQKRSTYTPITYEGGATKKDRKENQQHQDQRKLQEPRKLYAPPTGRWSNKSGTYSDGKLFYSGCSAVSAHLSVNAVRINAKL